MSKSNEKNNNNNNDNLVTIFANFLQLFRMREIKITYNHIKNIRARADTIIKDLEKRNLLDDDIEDEIRLAKSLDALDHLVMQWCHF